MDDQTDDRNPDRPPVGTPEELEEALKWLEELTARQGKPADVSNPAPAASLDSPFRGLIDSEDGDLPDWLRELPPSQLDNEPESRLDWLAKMAQQESIEELPTLEWRRLSEPTQDAILSGQSIDMPTEAFPGPLHSEDAASDTPPEITTETIDEMLAESTAPSPDTLPAEMPLPQPEDVVLESDELPDEESSSASESLTEAIVVEEEVAVEITPFEVETDTENSDEELIVPAIAPVTMGLDEILVEDRLAEDVAEQLSAEPEVFDGPLDDLDAAMAWIEELAASQDAPIEDVPSVADRALASKLMMEAGLTPSVSPLDELGSDSDHIEGMTPTHPFIEEEDFADTVVLVETLAADQGVTLESPAEPADVPEPEGATDEIELVETQDIEITAEDVDEPFDVAAAPEELSFEEAMAFLDEIAGEQAPLADEVIEPKAVEVEESIIVEVFAEDVTLEVPAEPGDELLPEVVADEETTSADFTEPDTDALESLSAEDVPWLETPAEELVVPPPVDLPPVEYAENLDDGHVVVEGLNGSGYDELEAALLSLDALALPPGKTLDEVNAKLAAAQMASWRDVDSALNWLEQTLRTEAVPAVAPSAELDDASLIEQMPEDPDAVLAWLEQMAAQEEANATDSEVMQEEASGIITDRSQSESLIEELAEADLLNMPDDPDEAMAWLEGLARGSHPTAAPAALQEESVGAAEPAFAEDEIDSSIGEVEFEPGELSALAPESAEAKDLLSDDEMAGEPEVEIFVDQEYDVVIIDTDLEDAPAPTTEDVGQDWTESPHEQTAAEAEKFVEPLDVKGDAEAEPEEDIQGSEAVVLEEMELRAEVEYSEQEEPQFEDAMTESLAVETVEPVIDEGVTELPEVALADEITERMEELPAAEEQPDEEVTTAPETAPQLPSWLDLLKPLD